MGVSTAPGILTYDRRSAPAHYLLEIGSYSTLLKSDLEKYESGVFEVGGYKWSLCLYPKGYKKENGSHHISLYLAIEEMNKSHSWEVKVKYKLFLLDQDNNTYTTFEDDEVRCFNKEKTQWGVAQLIDLDTFKERYLKNDSCTFGVEVLILNHARKHESFFTESTNANHVWEIKNFKNLKEEYYCHPGFIVGGCKWRIMLWPKGNGDEKNNSMSVFLELADSGRHRSKRRVYAEYKLRVRNQIDEDTENAKHREIIGSQWFSPSEAYGRRDMILLKDLHNVSKGYIKNNTVVVDATIVVISKVSIKSSLIM